MASDKAIPLDLRPCIMYPDMQQAVEAMYESIHLPNFEDCECSFQMQEHEGKKVVVRAICDKLPACRQLRIDATA